MPGNKTNLPLDLLSQTQGWYPDKTSVLKGPRSGDVQPHGKEKTPDQEWAELGAYHTLAKQEDAGVPQSSSFMFSGPSTRHCHVNALVWKARSGRMNQHEEYLSMLFLRAVRPDPAGCSHCAAKPWLLLVTMEARGSHQKFWSDRARRSHHGSSACTSSSRARSPSPGGNIWGKGHCLHGLVWVLGLNSIEQ